MSAIPSPGRTAQRTLSPMRRMILVVAVLAIVGVVVYRRRSIDRFEQELAIGRHADDVAAA